MKHLLWALTLPLALIATPELYGQIVVSPPVGGGYVSGGGLGFSYQGRRLSVSGFLGSFGVARYGFVPVVSVYPPPFYDPFGPPVGYPASQVIIKKYYTPPFLGPRSSLEEETAGVDLDLVPPKKKPEPAPKPGPEPPDMEFKLPGGKDVSVPRPPVRPEDLPPKKVEPPPPKKDEPKDRHAQLIEMGLKAFAEQEYGLAAQRFRAASEAEPKKALGHFLLAQAQFALGKYPEAVNAIHAGMRLQKNWPKVAFRPRLDLYKGNEADFVAHLKRLEDVLGKMPDQPTFLFLFAYQLWFDGRQADAMPLLRQARALTADPAYIDQFLAAGAAGPLAAK
jgi:hypothetical protein